MPTITMIYDDILNGERGSEESCPVALAIKRVTGKEVLVGEVVMKCGSVSAYTPDEVCDFILEFDAGLPVEPLVFEIPASLLWEYP